MGGLDGFEGVDGGGHQEAKRHMKEEEGSFLSRDGAGNNGLRNNLRRWQREEREKQSRLKRPSVERGYLPENETESAFVFLVSLLHPSAPCPPARLPSSVWALDAERMKKVSAEGCHSLCLDVHQTKRLQ